MKRKLLLAVVGVLLAALVSAGAAWAAEASRAWTTGLAQAGREWAATLAQAPATDEEQAAETGADDAPRRLAAGVVRGTVTEVADGRIVVETGEGQAATLLVDDSTRQWVPGQPPTSTLTLAVGDPVLALGRPVRSETGTKTLQTRLVVVADDEELPKIVVRGRVVAVTRQTIVVDTGGRERAITVRAGTALLAAGGRLGSLQEVRPGNVVAALGQPTPLGQWLAGLVLVGQGAAGGQGGTP
jgi:RNase P/RNase MRP subunit p29